jgi:hypothetical protein
MVVILEDASSNGTFVNGILVSLLLNHIKYHKRNYITYIFDILIRINLDR